MTDILKKSWNAFSDDIAQKYLKSFGHPSMDSKLLVYDVLKNLKSHSIKLVDLGCGNANLAEYLADNGLKFSYCGVDFSETLLTAARNAFPQGTYICDDVNTLNLVPKDFDIACYSHVIEMLESPESSLMAASKLAKKILIRFFEPPSDIPDRVELQEMNIGSVNNVPYLRRKMSMDYYQMILAKICCKQVDVYQSTAKDQVHVLHFS